MEKEIKYKENNVLSTPLSPKGLFRVHQILNYNAAEFIEADIPSVIFAMLRSYLNDPNVLQGDKTCAMSDAETIIALYTELRAADVSEDFSAWRELDEGVFLKEVYVNPK